VILIININNNYYKLAKYIILNLYFLAIIYKRSILAYILRERYIINNLYINIFIKVNLLILFSFIINLSKIKAIIISY
jgi:hypothetical protein